MLKKYLASMVVLFAMCCSLNTLAARENRYPATHTHKAFVLFYMSTCPHCRRFDPILKHYALEHHIPVLAYTMDGHSLPSFPDSFKPTPEELLRFFPGHNPVVPTLFMMDAKNHTLVPVLQGEATYNQLSMRVNDLKQLTQKKNKRNASRTQRTGHTRIEDGSNIGKDFINNSEEKNDEIS